MQGIPLIIFVVLLTLKLAGVINISWLMVFSPIWFPIALLFGIYLVAIICDFIGGLFK